MKKAAWANGKRGVFLIVFKQPGANVIETVDRVRAELPRLQAAIPPAINIEVVSDRTQTIRASVPGRAIHPSDHDRPRDPGDLPVPAQALGDPDPERHRALALLGTFGLMYLVGYSLDNLSLMALTIAVGFVVDDAIVMLENIVRYVENGEKPMDAAYKGAAEIGFTILSISISLIAVFIPLLLMGGIIGRLFREFAVVVTMTIAVSAFVSLTLTPMMASRLLSPHGKDEKHGRLYTLMERFFAALEHGYERGLDVVLRHRFATLLVFLATLAATVVLFIQIPKGFFPQQDTGFFTAPRRPPRTSRSRTCCAGRRWARSSGAIPTSRATPCRSGPAAARPPSTADASTSA